MLPDRVSNPGPLTYESGALPIALRGPAILTNKTCQQGSLPEGALLGCHLSFTSKFPDFSLTFSLIIRLFPDFFPDIFSFPYPLTDKKEIIFILYFNGANCITSNLRVTLKGKNLLPKGANSFLNE